MAENLAIKAEVFTLGCRVNQSESAMIEDGLRALCVEIVESGQDADLLVVNSCALTEFAEAKTRRAIKAFKKRNPQAKVCATGCYAQTNPQALLAAGVDKIVSNAEKKFVPQIALSLFLNQKDSPINASQSCAFYNSFEAENSALNLGYLPDLGFAGTSQISDRMNLKIQDGCDNACAYCIIPRARGLPRSRDILEIVKDAKNLVARGAREIILTGINMSKFDSSMFDLINRLSEIKNLLRIGIGSLEPPVKELEKLVDFMNRGGSKLAKHFHISMQSASESVLKNMRRKYSAKQFLEMVDFIKSANSDISIGTDLICGFPDETEDDFAETLANIKNSKISFLHVFTYSPRPQTVAALKKQIPLEKRKARSDELRLVGDELRRKFFESQFGLEREVLLENRLASGDYLGYTDNYLQVAVKINQAGLKNTLVKVKIASLIGKGRGRAQVVAL